MTANSDKMDLDQFVIMVLTYLSQNPDDLAGFLSCSGIAPGDLKQQLSSDTFKAGLMDYMLNQEEKLIAFLQHCHLTMKDYMRYRLSLPGAQKEFINREIIL